MGNEQFQFRFKGIEILSKDMVEPNLENISSEFRFNIRVETRIQAEQLLVIVVVFVTIRSEKTDAYLAKVNTACLFEIIEFEKHITLNELGEYVVPEQIDSIIKTVSIATVRGIVYSEFRGTYLNNAIMPVVFLNQFIPETPNKIEKGIIEHKIE